MKNILRKDSIFKISALSILTILFTITSPPATAGTLFMAADIEDFAGGLACGPSAGGGAGIDRLGKVTTNGSLVTNVEVICTDFLINGMADADGKLLAGTPGANPLNTVSFDGVLISSVAAPGIPNSGCCNEEMLFVPQGDGTAKFYHAHYADVIREIDPVTGVQIGTSFPQTDVVGMALINGEIWISKWSGKKIGTWDPGTNIFTSVFSLVGLGNAGALAWDPVSEILWVGSQGGNITPFNLAGVQQGVPVQPFGAFGQTIDGMTFLGEVTEVEQFMKTITKGPDADGDGEIDAVIALKQAVTTEYVWEINYNGPADYDAIITDRAPAESVVTAINADGTDLPLGCGGETDFSDASGETDVSRGGKAGKNCHSDTGLNWEPASNSETLEVTVEMRESPGKGHRETTFAPTSCGALYLNKGAVATLLDPATGELATNPATGELLDPLSSNQLCIAAVRDPSEFGFDADNDGDNLADHAEACTNEVRTDPCLADTDGDGINDNVDSCPVDTNVGDTDGDGIDDACDPDDDNDGIPDSEDH